MSERTGPDGRVIAAVSYIWVLGWVVALILHLNNPTRLGAFHLRQALGLLLLGVVVWMLNIASGILNVPLLSWLLSLGLFILWLIGLVNAIQSQERLIPLFGQQFQKWFSEVIRDS